MMWQGITERRLLRLSGAICHRPPHAAALAGVVTQGVRHAPPSCRPSTRSASRRVQRRAVFRAAF